MRISLTAKRFRIDDPLATLECENNCKTLTVIIIVSVFVCKTKDKTIIYAVFLLTLHENCDIMC